MDSGTQTEVHSELSCNPKGDSEVNSYKQAIISILDVTIIQCDVFKAPVRESSGRILYPSHIISGIDIHE